MTAFGPDFETQSGDYKFMVRVMENRAIHTSVKNRAMEASVHQNIVNDMTSPGMIIILIPGSFMNGLVPEPSVCDKGADCWYRSQVTSDHCCCSHPCHLDR